MDRHFSQLVTIAVLLPTMALVALESSAEESSQSDQAELKSDWTIEELLAGMEASRERYRHAEYRSIVSRYSKRREGHEREHQLDLDSSDLIDFRSDGTRMFTFLEHRQFDQHGRESANAFERGVFNGRMHTVLYWRGQRSRTLLVGQTSQLHRSRNPINVLWKGGKSLSWLVKALSLENSRVVGVTSTDGFPVVQVLSRVDSWDPPYDFDISISPEQSFLPVEVVVTASGKLDTSSKMSNLTRTSNGDWYPSEITIEYGRPIPCDSEKINISDLYVGREYRDSDFDTSIPLGVDVVDYRTGDVYFNGPWYPEISRFMREKFDWPPVYISHLNHIGSFDDGTIDGKPVPDFAVGEWINEPPTPSSDNPGVTVLFFFGGRLIEPTPGIWSSLKKLHQRYEANGLNVVGMATDDSPEATKQLVEELRIPFPVGIDLPSKEGGGHYGETRDHFGCRTYMGIYLIDRKGIVHTLPGNGGGGKESEAEMKVRELLGVEKPFESKYPNGLPIGPFRQTINHWKKLRNNAPKESMITGSVTVPEGTAIADFAQVAVSLRPELRLVTGGNTAGHMVNNSQSVKTLTTQCAADGTFTFNNLPKGFYRIFIDPKFNDNEIGIAVDEGKTATIAIPAENLE